MMPTINVVVDNKIARTTGTPTVVCGNDDYTVNFTLDSEWANREAIMVVTYMAYGLIATREVDIVNGSADLPVIHNAQDVIKIGVKTEVGSIRTTSAAVVPVINSVTDGGADRPTNPTVQEQINQLAHDIRTLAMQIASVDLRCSMIETRLGVLQFDKLTKTEYEAITTKEGNTVYYVVDENGGVKQYLGDVLLSGGSGGEPKTGIQLTTAAPIIAPMEKGEEVT